MNQISYTINPIGTILSVLTSRDAAPHQGTEGAPEAWIELNSAIADGLEGISAGNEIIVILKFRLKFGH